MRPSDFFNRSSTVQSGTESKNMRLYLDGELFDGQTSARIEPDGDRFRLITDTGSVSVAAVRVGDEVLVSHRGFQYKFSTKPPSRTGAGAAASGETRAPMPGLIVDVRVKVGDSVTKGQTLVVLEAMKTQQPLLAPFDGEVAHLGVVTGQQVEDSAVLFRVTPK